MQEIEGHAAGVEAIRGLLKHAVRRAVPVLTLYAFSRENWARSDDEVIGLFGLLEEAIRQRDAGAAGAGRPGPAPRAARRAAGSHARVDRRGAARDLRRGRLLLNIAFNYAGRTELVDAVRKLIASGVDPETVDEATVGDALYTAGLPDPDLVIRTGGEQRLSNFLIWQSAYAEFSRARRSGRTSGRPTSTRPWRSSQPDESALRSLTPEECCAIARAAPRSSSRFCSSCCGSAVRWLALVVDHGRRRVG